MTEASQDKKAAEAAKPAHAEKAAEAAKAAEAKKSAEAAKAAEVKKTATGAKRAGKDEAWLIVSGPERGRRRAGHAFGKSPVEICVADLTDEQLAAIKGDPQLASAIEMRPTGEAGEGA